MTPFESEHACEQYLARPRGCLVLEHCNLTLQYRMLPQMNVTPALSVLLALSLVPLAAVAEAQGEDKIQGTWRDADRKSLIEFSKDAAGQWSGKTLQAVRKEEVGKKVFRKLVYDAKTGAYVGLMIKPDDDDDVTMNVTVTLVSETSMKAVVKKFIFSKTISLSKEAPPQEPKK